MSAKRLEAEYVIPVRWSDDSGLAEFTTYLRRLNELIDVTVVDGSRPPVFAVHRAAWSGLARHLSPEPWHGANGKVGGVMTGLRRSRWDLVILADDDVRYDEQALHVVLARLRAGYDIVRPQNYFVSLPWHARWDTARTLLNRAFGADFPGTFGVRRQVVLEAGGYRGDVLFENLELLRTVHAAGGSESRADDVFVGRIPPRTRHFLGQRVRQAYDDFAQPTRLLVELSFAPVLLWAFRRRSRLVLVVATSVGLAEWGRHRAGGAAVFPPSSAAWAPLWVVERAVCVWLALAARLRGGVRYADGRLRVAASSPRSLASARENTARSEGNSEGKENP